MAGLKLDDVLTDLEFTADRGVCRLIDEAKNAEFLLGFDRGFRVLVLDTPPGRGDVISLEPYTQTTDAINLQARGVAAGLRILGHGAGCIRHHHGNPWLKRESKTVCSVGQISIHRAYLSGQFPRFSSQTRGDASLGAARKTNGACELEADHGVEARVFPSYSHGPRAMHTL